MRLILLFVLIFSSIFIGRSALADARPGEWEITTIAPQRFLFEKKKDHVTVMVDIEGVTDTEETYTKFVRSSDFLKAMKLVRTREAMGVTSENYSVGVSREQYGPYWVGVTESLFSVGDKSAALTERWWIRAGFSFHVAVMSIGNFTASADTQAKIFEPFAQDLGLTSGKNTLWKQLVPEAYAELGRANTNQPGVTRAGNKPGTKPSAQPDAIDCQRDAEKLGIDLPLARKGPPVLNTTYAEKTCGSGMKRVWTETVKSIHDAGDDYANRQKRYMDQMGCMKMKLNKGDLIQAKKDDSWYQSTKRYLYNSFVQSSTQQMQSECLQNSGAAAAGEMAGNAAVSTAKALGSLAVFSSAVVSELTVGQVRRMYQLVRYNEISKDDPTLKMMNYISQQWTGFKCLNDKEQTARACKLTAEIGVALGSAAVTGGAGAALRFVKVARVVDGAVKAEQAAAKGMALARAAEKAEGLAAGAAEKAAAGKVAEEAAAAAKETQAARVAAANKVRDAKLSARERARVSNKVLGHEVSTGQKDAIERAHLYGKPGPNGQYSQAVLKEKLRILQASGLSPADAAKLIRTGLSGTSTTSVAGAAATGGASHADDALKPGESIAESTIVVNGGAGKPASYFQTQAADTIKRYERDLADLDNPEVSRAERVTRDIPFKASEVSRTLMRSISPEDIAKTEFVAEGAGGRYMQMMRYASHAGTETSRDAGSMMARVIKELPAEKREDFVTSLNAQYSSQNRVLRGEVKPAPRTPTYGRNIAYTIDQTYRDVVTNAMGYTSRAQADEAAAFFKRLDSSNLATQKEAVTELLAKPQMQGINRDEFMDLRANAAGAVTHAGRLAQAEAKVAKEATEAAQRTAAENAAAARAAKEKAAADARREFTTTVRLNDGPRR